jgi:polyphosphate kinase
VTTPDDPAQPRPASDDTPAVEGGPGGDRFRKQVETWLEAKTPAAPGPPDEEAVRRLVRRLEEEPEPDLDTDAPAPQALAPTPSGLAAPEPTEAESATTPPEILEPPVAGADGTFDLDAPELYLNRELTWLNFCFRVLNEAHDSRTPLLERVRFIAIVSNNLDEFFMKRVGGLKQQVGAGVMDRTIDGHTPQEQVELCYELVRRLETAKRDVLALLLEDLAEQGIALLHFHDLPQADQDWLRNSYLENIYPLVTPQATDPAHPFPFVSNLSLNLLVTLHYPNNPTPSMARVKVPVGSGIPRFLKVRDSNTFVDLESVMAANLDLLFPGMDIDRCDIFRVTRNANTEREEEQAEDLLAMIESELRDRKFAPIVRIEVSRQMSTVHRGMLAAELGLDEQTDVFPVEGMLGMRDLIELAAISDPELHDPPHHPVDHPAFTTDRNMFHVIRDRGSILLHHPYQSFSTSVERFLREASRDPKVRAIKMALYRTSEGAIDDLIEAARNGKQVAVVVELKARFDEEANIRWAARLEQVGIHVTYGVVGLKTHCKVILVLRQDYTGLRRYAHVGTGNYHAGTARLYSDVGLLTADPDIGADLTELFNYLTTGYKPKRNYRRLLPSPKVCKQALIQKIEREMDHVAHGRKGLIQFKMNALEDAQITRTLYRAAQAGVQIDLIIRDTCRLRPGIPGLSESVQVISIVDRFLEHARIYYFHNDGSEEYFIGSADCMARNLNSRVEVLCPVNGEDLQTELRYILETQLDDDLHAWDMRADGSFVQRRPKKPNKARGSQQILIDYYEKERKRAGKLKRRKTRGFTRRNLR